MDVIGPLIGCGILVACQQVSSISELDQVSGLAVIRFELWRDPRPSHEGCHQAPTRILAPTHTQAQA
jgi:hypothetical protein